MTADSRVNGKRKASSMLSSTDATTQSPSTANGDTQAAAPPSNKRVRTQDAQSGQTTSRPGGSAVSASDEASNSNNSVQQQQEQWIDFQRAVDHFHRQVVRSFFAANCL